VGHGCAGLVACFRCCSLVEVLEGCLAGMGFWKVVGGNDFPVGQSGEGFVGGTHLFLYRSTSMFTFLNSVATIFLLIASPR